jgi:hypothetical protein
MWVLGDDTENDDSQLILQCKTLLYRNSRWKSLQASIDVEHNLIVFRMIAQFFECRHRIALLAINAEKKWPHTAT